MKTLVVAVSLFAQILAVSSTISITSNTLCPFVVGENGIIQYIDPMSTIEDSPSTPEELNKTVRFYLISNSTKSPEQIYVDDASALKSSSFNCSLQTVIMINGWLAGAFGPYSSMICNAYRDAGYNVIVVDWGGYSHQEYFFACSKIVAVGKYVALLIDFLTTQGMSIDDLTVIGHSLGAHVGGVACRNSNDTVPILIGMDPAGPGFYGETEDARMSSTDAEYVQHQKTNADCLGNYLDLGVVTIWVNGGSVQNGCFSDDLGICSHLRAYRYHSESITIPERPFVCYHCANYSAFEAGSCRSNDWITLGGVNIDMSARGIYFVDTNPMSTFAEG